MERLIINPSDFQSQYIAHLNECFKGWGGTSEYQWVFERKVGEHSSDILIIENDQDGVIAGSAITYRRLKDERTVIDIGVISGSWTLPAARRKGCLTKFVEESKRICYEKKIPFICAFMMDTNPSSRRLRAAGSHMFPTYHLFSPEVPFKDIHHDDVQFRKKNPELVEQVFQRMNETQRHNLRFDYTLQEFKDQYIHRLEETILLQLEEDFILLAEGADEMKILLLTYPNADRFLTYMKIISNWCLKIKSKKAFYFTTRKGRGEASIAIGFKNLPGYFTILETGKEEVEYAQVFQDLHINMADKM